MPDAVGVPLIVMVLPAHAAVTPAGNPVAAPMAVAPVVAWVNAVIAVLIHKVGVEDAAPAVLIGVTVIVLVALTTTPHAAALFDVKVRVTVPEKLAAGVYVTV